MRDDELDTVPVVASRLAFVSSLFVLRVNSTPHPFWIDRLNFETAMNSSQSLEFDGVRQIVYHSPLLVLLCRPLPPQKDPIPCFIRFALKAFE